jgi:ribosomal protein L31
VLAEHETPDLIHRGDVLPDEPGAIGIGELVDALPVTCSSIRASITLPHVRILFLEELLAIRKMFDLRSVTYCCNYYNYMLTRTWTVTDCAGNSAVFTQKINVHDTTAPVAVCKNETVSLGGTGEYTLGQLELNSGSYDNCAMGNQLSFQLSKITFNCDNIGNNLVVMTVKDPCGNTDTCHAVLNVLEGSGKCHPVYDAVGSETCVCLDNATNATNGQFSEVIQMEAKAGLVLTVKSSTGLFRPNSPAPPAAPLPVSNGTLLALGVSDGIDRRS